MVALAPNPSANDGIYVIFTHVIVVPFVGTNGLLTFWNVHLFAVVDNVIGYVHGVEYSCVVSAVRFHVVPSHQSTVYALEKYLFIFKVWFAAVDVASITISLLISCAFTTHIANVPISPMSHNVAFKKYFFMTIKKR